MNELKRLLTQSGVTFTEFRFESDGIDRNPFTIVGYATKDYHVIKVCIIYRILMDVFLS